MSECVCTCENRNTLPAAISECFGYVYMRHHDTCHGYNLLQDAYKIFAGDKGFLVRGVWHDQ